MPAQAAALTAEQAAQEVRLLQRALTALHPALTKYLTPAELDAAFARFQARGNAARSSGEMLLAAAEMAAALRCGHTWTNVRNQGGATRALLLESADKLPFTLTWIEGRWLVLASTVPEVVAGDEVLAINGVAAADMVKRLMPYLRADGSSDNKRLRQLGHDRFDHSALDILWPLLSPPPAGRYRIELRPAPGRPSTVEVHATTLSQRQAVLQAQGTPVLNEAWRLHIDASAEFAMLTLPSFSFWNSSFDWSKFIDDSFAELQAKKIPNLVLDIRDNEGGDERIVDKLLSQLLRQPYSFGTDQSVTAYERAPYALARYLDTWDFGFFDRTGQVEKVSEGTAAGLFRVTSRAAGTRTIAPAAAPYLGQTFLLVGGENSSATFLLARRVQDSGAAVLVGQTTGGNLRGLNGGQLAWFTLPHSGVAVDIPLLAGGYAAKTPDAAVTPDITVTRTFEARRQGRDLELEAVQREIVQRRRR